MNVMVAAKLLSLPHVTVSTSKPGAGVVVVISPNLSLLRSSVVLSAPSRPTMMMFTSPGLEYSFSKALPMVALRFLP